MAARCGGCGCGVDEQRAGCRVCVLRMAQRRWRARWPELARARVRAGSREWARKNPGKVREKSMKRRAEKARVRGDAEGVRVKVSWWESLGVVACGYCGEELAGGHGRNAGQWCVDHYRPLHRGGPNVPSNLVLSCHRCNTSKGGKWPERWLARKRKVTS